MAFSVRTWELVKQMAESSGLHMEFQVNPEYTFIFCVCVCESEQARACVCAA